MAFFQDSFPLMARPIGLNMRQDLAELQVCDSGISPSGLFRVFGSSIFSPRTS
jgi:hypothetical protein